MTIVIVTGTRPEIIKMYPIIRQFDSRSIDYKYIHTGQHYDYSLFLKFIQEFGIRKPDVSIAADISNPVNQVATIMEKLGVVINQIKPSLVLVEGDTNSVLASALSALKSNVPIAHVESGLRSYDWKTVEEHNRRIVDHVSDVLFSPTNISSANLENERVHGKIYTVGNTVIDAINLSLQGDISYNKNSDGTSELSSRDQQQSLNFGKDTHEDDYILVTLHRSENVDDIDVLKQVLGALTESNLKYLFPMHPHTMKRIQEYELKNRIGKNIRIIEPVGYLDFLKLLKHCTFAITDSGGVQEEITSPSINKRALVLRDSTERPESINSNHSVLCKIDQKTINSQIQKLASEIPSTKVTSRISPYGAGNAAIKIAEIIEKKFR
jgi:UDP-N-acetylglucosamine 2-epimerase (non-hydrolysing)